jgi:hypothetical protein
MNPRRTTLTKAEQALLRKLQRGTWRADELDWLLAHLPADTPTLLVQQLHSKLIDVHQSAQANAYIKAIPLVKTAGGTHGERPARYPGR